MKRILSLIYLVVMIAPIAAIGQQKDASFYKNLVQKNAKAIGISLEELNNSRISDAYYDQFSKAYLVYLQQTFKGADVNKSMLVLSFRNEILSSKTGELLLMNEKNVNNSLGIAKVPAAKALIAVANDLEIVVPPYSIAAFAAKNDGRILEFGNLANHAENNVIAKLVWDNNEQTGKWQLCWEIEIMGGKGNSLWHYYMDANNNQIVRKQNLTISEKTVLPSTRTRRVYITEDNQQKVFEANSNQTSYRNMAINSSKYNVIPYPKESPLTGNPTLVTNPWTQNFNQNANTLKWNNDGTKDYDITQGNNVYVQADDDGKDATFGYAPKSSTAIPDLTFNFLPDYNEDPVTDIFTKSFGETNLFYWCNLMHDMSYQYGFDEVGGNFQASNIARGGKETDYVIADAQDASGTDNANFATPADGSKPRMQMFMWGPGASRITYANSPLDYAGYKLSKEGSFSTNNKLSQTGAITGDVVIYKDLVNPDSSTGCGQASNAAALAGKIVFIDRGSCAFTVKFKNAQTVGAKAVIIGNVASDDPRYSDGSSGNVLVNMGGTDNTITVPGVFVMHDTAVDMKTIINEGKTLNLTLSPTPNIDGALDNGVVAHEYTHGISTRLSGGPGNSGCISNAEAMGEGWSDYYGIMITQDWANSKITDGKNKQRPVGNYAVGLDSSFGGIRTYPYSTSFDINPWVYDTLRLSKDIKEYTLLGELSGDIAYRYFIGDFWCTTLWEMTWELVNSYGISPTVFDPTGTGGNVIALSLVTQGLKLQKCSPGCVDGRDAILKADTLLYGGKYSKEIWKAFARRGLGFSATQGSTTKIKDGVGAYDLPLALPVKWGSFTASKQGSSALLKWTTVSENNADKFIVERSADGRSFVQVGNSVKASNNGNGSSYSLVDSKPINGNNIYRIKQIDLDGKFDYSGVQNLNFADLKPLITMAPNPAKDFVNIKVEGNKETLSIQIVSAGGQIIGTYTMNGDNTTINISSLAHGIYGITIKGSDYTAKYKLVVD